VGHYSVTVQVADSASPAQTDTKSITINVVRGTSTLAVNPVILSVSTNPLGISITIGSVSARLTGGTLNVPIGGATIVFKAGTTTVCTGVTDSNGNVNCAMTVTNTLVVISKKMVTATFAGNALWLPSSGTAGLAAVK
jgi:hypothetical protein